MCVYKQVLSVWVVCLCWLVMFLVYVLCTTYARGVMGCVSVCMCLLGGVWCDMCVSQLCRKLCV